MLAGRLQVLKEGDLIMRLKPFTTSSDYKILKFLTLLAAVLLMAAPAYALSPPPSFKVNGDTAVFVDFTSVQYVLTFNQSTQKATAVTTIKFNAIQEGNPLFDSVHTPQGVTLDGQAVTTTLIKSPGDRTSYQMVNQRVLKGQHTLVIRINLVNGVKFTGKGPVAGFFTNDLVNRHMLERYVPANLEYDQMKMDFIIQVTGGNAPDMDLFVNGQAKKVNARRWDVSYPAHYNSGALYFRCDGIQWRNNHGPLFTSS